MGGTLFFTAYDDTNGYELWKSDGTATGTVLVKDIRGGSTSSAPRNLVAVGNTLYFRAYTDANGYELWKSDGTAAGTVLVKDINSGSTGSYPNYLTNVSGKLFFQASDGSNGAELWTSDGTSAGTRLVKDINAGSSGSYPGYLAAANGKLFFTAYSVDQGYELWTSDGTSAGTVLVKDIQSGATGGYPRDLVSMGTQVFFSAADGQNGYELWKSDGTASGTVLVKDILPGGFGSYPFYLANAGGKLLFRANDGSSGYELFSSDGTATGTVLVKDIRNISGSYPTNLADLNGSVIFSANSGGIGRELWKSDGTKNGTTLLKDIYPGGTGSSPSELIKSGSYVYFRATDRSSGSELWRTDGTIAGTVEVSDIRSGLYGSYPQQLTDIGGTLFFVARGTNLADGSSSGYELWKTDGTQAGTVLVKDINSGGSGSYPTHLTNVNGTLYFTAYTPTTGYELWKSNGTEAGTTIVKEIGSGATGGYLSELTNVNGKLFFRAYQSGSGYELWKSDGTNAGTVLVKDIRPTVVYNGTTYENSFPSQLTNVGGTLFFRAYTYESGYELWKSDGTSTGTVLVKDINTNSSVTGTTDSSFPTNFTALNNKLFFSAYNPSSGYELWTSDGTANGTVLVKDIYSGTNGTTPNSAYPSQFKAFGGKLYFQANSTSGVELWQTDGTSTGTTLAKDIWSGTNGSAPLYLTPSGDRLFFSADDGVLGRELWSVGDPVGTLSFSTSTATVAEGSSVIVSVKLTTGGDPLASALTVSIVPTSSTATSADYTLSATSVTFPAGSTSGMTKSIILSTVQDQIAEGDDQVMLTLQNVSGVGQVDTKLAVQAVSIIDDDNAGISITKAAALSVDEAGSKVTFTVALNSIPTSNVTIPISSTDSTQGTVSPTSLTFTPANALTPQTVTITGVKDNVLDGNQLFTILTGSAQSTDTKYNGLDPEDVQVTSVDGDKGSVVVTVASGLQVTEQGGIATFTVALGSLPKANVTIDLSSSNAAEGTVSPSTLTFTPTNGTTPQTVTITGVDDQTIDGDQIFKIILAAAKSTDTAFNSVDPADVTVTNRDNDQASIVVTPTNGLTVSESGTQTTFTIALSSLPSADVTIPLSSSDATQGTVSPSSLTFTKTNGMTPQTVTVTGVHDFAVDPNKLFQILVAAATSSDSHYNGLNGSDVQLTSSDIDQAGIQVQSSGLVLSENGTSATFSVVLQSKPTSNVTIAISSSDEGEAAVSVKSLTFTPTNALVRQTITVTGVDDSTVDGNQAFKINLAPSVSTDPLYQGLDAADLDGTNADNDQPGIIVTQAASLSVSEKGTAVTFTIALTKLPVTDVTIDLTSSNSTQGTVSPAKLTFTSANALTPQTVTVTGVDDGIADGTQAFAIITSTTQSTDASYNGLSVDDVGVTSFDDGRRPYQNPRNLYDVNDDNKVTPLDALLIINDIARNKTRVLPSTHTDGQLYVDVSGDETISALDALRVINEIARNKRGVVSTSGEGESLGTFAASASLVQPPDDPRSQATQFDDLLTLLARDQARKV